jgi:Ribbon-helix-helix domain
MVSRSKGKQAQVTSYYEPSAVEQLKKLSGATRIPQAAYLREALDDLLKKHAAVLRKAAKARTS